MSEIHIKYLLLVVIIATVLPAPANHTEMGKKDDSLVSVVVIDPGHGGKDLGTVGGKVEEKDVVLDIALKLGNFIENNFPDVEVIYTRKTDVFIPVYQRAAIANQADADLFISIHANAIDYKYVQGTETFVLGQHRSEDNLQVAKKENAVILLEDDYIRTYEGFDPNSAESYIMFELVQDEYKEQSISLANAIQNEFRLHARRKDRSVKEAGFLVLRQISMPGVLVETGFLSNPSERNYLNSEKGRKQIALAIFRAFTDYKSDVEQKSSFHLISDVEKPPLQQNPGHANDSINGIKQNSKDSIAEEVQYYSIQIMALKKKLATTPENFSGLNNVFRIDAPDISRYYSGRYSSLEKAESNKELLISTYESAFVVAFTNNELIPVKKFPEN
jgi:N-acetylmuramoyl-L-alanine amidase